MQGQDRQSRFSIYFIAVFLLLAAESPLSALCITKAKSSG